MKFLVTSDWHLRSDKPRCRLDDNWYLTQASIVDEIKRLCILHSAPVLIAGDIFHKAKSSAEMESLFLSRMLTHATIIPGQHDMPGHNIDKMEESSFNVLVNARVKYGCDNQYVDWVTYGDETDTVHRGEYVNTILLIHELVVENESNLGSFTNVSSAYDVLKRFPDYKYIIAGDNHHGFIHKSRDGRYVIVPGSITRQSSDMLDHQPRVVLIDTDADTVTSIDLPDDITMVTDEFVKKEKEQDERINTFVETLRDSKRVSLSFIDNLHTAMRENELEEGVTKIIHELLEGVGE